MFFFLHLNTDSLGDATAKDTSYASYLTNDVWFHTQQQQQQEEQAEAETEHNTCEQLQPIDFSVKRLDENGIHNDSNMCMAPMPNEKVVQQWGENNIQQGIPCICCYTLCLLSSLLPEEPCHCQSCGCQDVSLLGTPMHGIDST